MALRAGSFVTKNRGGSSDSISGVNFEGGSVRTGKASRHAREACPTALERSRPSRRFQPRQEPSNGASRAPHEASRGALRVPNALPGFVPTIDFRSFAQLAQLFPHSASAHSHNWLNCSHKQDSAPSRTRRDYSHTRNPPSQHVHPFPLGPSCDDFPH